VHLAGEGASSPKLATAVPGASARDVANIFSPTGRRENVGNSASLAERLRVRAGRKYGDLPRK
jgi:hypothetical protein